MAVDPYLSDLMNAHGFSIQSMETVVDAASNWGDSRGGTGFDVSGRWREVALLMRRDLVCEACGAPFDYTFRVVAGGVAGRGQRMWHSSTVSPRLERELRRRIRCPRCRAVQRQARRAFRRRERRHSLVGVITVGGTVAGSGLLSSGGYALAGAWGLVAGLGFSLCLVLFLTRWMLAQLLDPIAAPVVSSRSRR